MNSFSMINVIMPNPKLIHNEYLKVSAMGFKMKKGVLLFGFGSPVWEESQIYIDGFLPRLEHHVIFFSMRQGVDSPLPGTYLIKGRT